ncbi:MAG TPA: glycosyltransferase family 39 protein [Pseudolabrys sp.]|nr:glycosyltransferase family 39 protein [Pseudolabrys sp.]
MHYVSLIVEFLRGRPAVVFWVTALSQAALWVIVPSLFYSAPPGDVPMLLAIGHEFRLGSYLGPPLAFWLGEMSFRLAGIYGVYLLSQVCIVIAFWAVFSLGRIVAGTRHAVLAVLLMVGIAAFNVPSPEFGPSILATALWALALLHYWRALGEDRRGYWFILGFDLGLLLLTSYVGVILIVLLILFTVAVPRGQDALRHIEPWLSLVLSAIVVFPHAVWLRDSFALVWATIVAEAPPDAWLPPAGWLTVVIVLSHIGVGLLVLLASGWRLNRNERAPEIDRNPAMRSARLFVYVFALVPALAAIATAAALGHLGPLMRVGPFIVLTALAIVVAAGDRVYLYRERAVSMVWLGLLTVPPALVVLAILFLPWTLATALKTSQPAGAMGNFFADNFQRRTGQPLAFVAGDPNLASLVAASAPSRPRLYLDSTPERSPWANAADLRASGAILVWPATDTAGTPPVDLKAIFPEIVPELPRAFAWPVQGLLPLKRVGWAVLRPAR